MSTYPTGLAAIGKTVLALDPEAPLALRLTWCLLRAWRSAAVGALLAALAPLDRRAGKLLCLFCFVSRFAVCAWDAVAARLVVTIDVT